MEEIAMTAEFIPIGCEFVFYSLMMAITAFSGVTSVLTAGIVYLYLQSRKDRAETLKLAAKSADMIELIPKLLKNNGKN